MLRRFREIESFDLLDVTDPETGRIKPVTEWSDSARKAVVGFDIEDIWGGKGERIGTKTKIRIESRSRALESLARHVGFYPNGKIELGAGDGLVEILEAAKNSPLGSPQSRIMNGATNKNPIKH